MMQKLREKLHYFLYALIAVFIITIFLSWGAGGADVFSTRGLVGKIGEKSISQEEFENSVKIALENYQNQSGQEIPENQMDAFRKQVWDNLVNQYILEKEIAKRNLTFSDSEFVYATFKDPLPTFKQNPSLMENGRFSEEKYKQALIANPQIADNLLQYARSYFPEKTMRTFIENALVVSDAELIEYYKTQNLKANLKYFGILKSKISNDEIQVSDDEIKNYYEKNIDDYKSEEKRKVEYIRIDMLPSAKDTAVVFNEMIELKNKIQNDDQFREEAMAVSEDRETGDKGGETEFFVKGDHSEIFEANVFNANLGDIVGPILDNDRYFLVKLIDRKTDKKADTDSLKVLQIVKYIFTGNMTIDFYDQLSLKALELAKEGSLKTYAEENSIFYNETSYFTKTGFIPGIGSNGYLNDFIFRKNVGDVSSEVRVNKGKTIFIVKILDIKKEGTLDLEEAKSRITTAIISEKKGTKAKEILSKYLTDLKSKSFEEVALSKDLADIAVTDTTGFVNYYDKFIRGIGRSAEIIKFISASSTTELSQVIETSTGVYVFELLKKNSFSESDFESNKSILRSTIMNQKKQQIFSEWFKSIKENYSIEEYRVF